MKRNITVLVIAILCAGIAWGTIYFSGLVTVKGRSVVYGKAAPSVYTILSPAVTAGGAHGDTAIVMLAADTFNTNSGTATVQLIGRYGDLAGTGDTIWTSWAAIGSAVTAGAVGVTGNSNWTGVPTGAVMHNIWQFKDSVKGTGAAETCYTTIKVRGIGRETSR